MAEPEATTPEAPKTPAIPQLRILGQFIRDMSFENIVSRNGSNGAVTPDVQVQVALDAKKRGEGQFEVTAKFNITSKNKESEATLFVLELEYGGIFAIENVPDDQLHPFLMIECPRMLFPFVRRIVSDVTHDGGFAPLNLDTIDFVALYRQSLQQRAAAQKASEAKPN
ncbi:protein-export chaperone SecB [Oceaniovalibus sp. ACAM 378]|jgi:preprotein translocase subunit SecB|uniref:protein-export chaperone SecB n=1 Tax=Oceaniovalibus sp. ACAM 378 TaxID=2599923 RepID=UPI0011D41AE3|nr:protein-export chaperone SecB [Oceaniovalibus sp. ACAM 378]TYB86437.1 protein-export chaperone SecB [Oceaniovalibus sp. ACAM 378]